MKKLLIICTFSICLISCKKTKFDEIKVDNVNPTSAENFNARMNTGTPTCEDCNALETSYADTIDNPTILGGVS